MVTGLLPDQRGVVFFASVWCRVSCSSTLAWLTLQPVLKLYNQAKLEALEETCMTTRLYQVETGSRARYDESRPWLRLTLPLLLSNLKEPSSYTMMVGKRIASCQLMKLTVGILVRWPQREPSVLVRLRAHSGGWSRPATSVMCPFSENAKEA